MINEIIESICTAIHFEFGSDYEIYTETVEQGLKAPCFFVMCINPLSEQFLNKRYFISNKFCVQYFPVSADKKAECNFVLERLMDLLEMLSVSNQQVRGTKMNAEFADDVLHFFVNYDMFVYKEKGKEPAMESAEYNSSLKGIEKNG